MATNHYEVLITSANTNAALAVTRSLGKKGITVTCADCCKNAKSFYSKYCKNKFIYPSPEEQPEDFIESLSTRIKKNHYDVLFPITDIDMYLISKYPDAFLPYVKVAMNENSTFMKVLDKSQTIKIASEINVPTPKTVFVNDTNELNGISKTLRYPVIIKPRQSCVLISNRIISASTIRVASHEELVSKYVKLHKRSPFPLIQEYIPGQEEGIFMLLHKGQLKAIFNHRRIRSVHPLGGVSCLRESVEINPEMRDYAIKILREINWEGVAMVEFKIDSRDNIPKLMEINGRFWGSLQLAVSSGVDFPYLLFKTIIGEDTEAVLDYKKGILCRDLRGDFAHLFFVMFLRDKGFEYPKRLPALWNFIRFYQKNLVYDDLSFDDPKLTLRALINIVILPRSFFKYLEKTHENN